MRSAGGERAIKLVARDDAGNAAALCPDDRYHRGKGNKAGDPRRHRDSKSVRDALQRESLDREHAERQNDQDQERKTPRIDPEKQAAEGVMAIGFDSDVIGTEPADRESDQGR